MPTSPNRRIKLIHIALDVMQISFGEFRSDNQFCIALHYTEKRWRCSEKHGNLPTLDGCVATVGHTEEWGLRTVTNELIRYVLILSKVSTFSEERGKDLGSL